MNEDFINWLVNGERGVSMEKTKLKLFKTFDMFIRFMGLIGGAVLAFIGIFKGWWNGDIGSLVYVLIFSVSLLYCSVYNGEYWT